MNLKHVAVLSLFFIFIAFGVSAAPAPSSFSDVVKTSSDGVVNISTTKMVTRSMSPMMNDEFFRYFFGGELPGGGMGGAPQQHRTNALGSGFVIDEAGYIVTNNHVIADAEEIVVKLKDGKELKASVVGADPLTDLALLKVEPKGIRLKPIAFGNSDAIEIGDWVVAIGNPMGLGGTVTAGIISAKGRVLGDGPYDNFLQTDASINPGNSGGPLLNMQGEVVGVNTAIIQAAQGLGFAVPVNMLRDILPKLKQGKVVRGWLGVTLQVLDENLAKSFNLPEDIKGVLVADVSAGQPADRAGIRAGDVITSVDGRPVEDVRTLVGVIGAKSPNESAKLTVLRDAKKVDINVKLGERPTEVATTQQGQGGGKKGVNPPENSPIVVVELNKADAQALGIKDGVIVASVKENSAVARTGLKRGDVIVLVNKKQVESPEQFYSIMNGIKKGEIVGLKIATRNGARFLAFNKD